MYKPRQYQEDAIESAIGSVEVFGETNVVLEAPTGSGKSLIISELAKRLTGNIVIVVNITPLIEQIAEHLTEMNIDFSIVKAGMDEHYNESHRVQLVMSQTFYSRAEKLGFSCDYLIIDERHREYNTERTNYIHEMLKPKATIGLTATPYDQAGYALSGSFLLPTVSVKELTEQGFLSRVKYLVPKWSTDLGLDELRMSGSDYSGSAIDEKFNNNEYMNQVLSSMNAINAQNKKTLVFCNSIAQCEAISDFLRANGYLSEAIHSEKHNKENDVILKSFKACRTNEVGSTNTRCLVSVSKLNIGFDVKDIELGVGLRPTKVRSLYVQMIGRLTRIAEGKEFAEYLDLAGTIMEHGFHNELYSPPLPGDKNARTMIQDELQAKEIAYIAKEEPTEITRVDIDVVVKELKEKEKKIHEMDIKDLNTIFTMSSDIHVVTEIAFRIKEIKTGEPYKSKTVDWISDKWDLMLFENPEKKIQWLKAFKTRSKTIVRDNKKLASLYYFADFLVEKKDEVYYGS